VSAGFVFSRSASDETETDPFGSRVHNFAALDHIALCGPGKQGAIRGAEVIDATPYVGDGERDLHIAYQFLTKAERETVEAFILSGVPRERVNALIASTPNLEARKPYRPRR
jgi:hypothetical protein